jgi:hypothetical protein
VREEGFAIVAVHGLERNVPVSLLGGNEFILLKGVSFAGEGDGIGLVVMLCSLHCIAVASKVV